MSVPFVILSVDDNPNNLFALRALLKRIPDCEIIDASSGEEVLSIVFERAVNLILLDIQMPVMDGFETAHRLQISERTRNIPIIFITAVYKSEEFVNRGYAIGGVDYLTKPIDDDLLINRIQLYRRLHERECKMTEAIEKLLIKEKELMTALKNATDANIANREKSSFLAIMSHEIRTPLNSVLGLTEALLETKLDKDQYQLVLVAHAAGENLLYLINDILDLSRVESGAIQLEKIPFFLAVQIGNSISIIEHRALEKNISIRWKIHPDVVNCRIGDPTRLRQVLINLLGNAVKFSEKGEISLTVTNLEGPEHFDQLLFVISDQGIGIPKDKIDTLFNPYVQVDNTITRRFGGTGLGLVISKRLVELMQGKIWLESEVGKGTTFFFTLRLPVVLTKNGFRPLEEGINGKVNGEVDSRVLGLGIDDDIYPLSKQRPLQILLAEDSKMNQLLMEVFLKKEPHTLVLVENGLEAIEKIKNQNFDIVLMDVQMPIMDGYTATREIRKWEEETGRKPIPILALTAHAFEENIRASLNAGCTEHVTKPIKKTKLLELLRKYSL